MRELPKCKLCGASPDSADHDHGTIVWCSAVPEDEPCVLGGRMMTEAHWRSLMGPSAVSEANIDRVVEAWEICGVLSRATIRAVLEVALKE